MRRLWRRCWRAWCRFWIAAERPAVVYCPPRTSPIVLAQVYQHHPLPGHPTERILADDLDEALSEIAGGTV